MAMIGDILSVFRDRLENLLQNASPQAGQWVLLGGAVARDGGDLHVDSNKLVISLVGLQSDVSTGAFEPPRVNKTDWHTFRSPPLYLDVYFMVTANFSEANYEIGLRQLSRVIAYFQQTPIFTHDNAPSLTSDMDKLVVEFVSLDFAQQSHVMTCMGMKYAPCVFYRARRLPFAAEQISGAAPTILSTGAGDPPAGPAR